MRKDCDRKAPLFAEPTGVASGEYRETVEPSTAPRSVSAGTAAHHPIGESDGSRCLLRCDGGLTARCRALSPHRRSRSARGEDCSQPLPAGIGGSGRHAFGCFLGPHARGSRVPVWRRELPAYAALRIEYAIRRGRQCGAGFPARCGSRVTVQRCCPRCPGGRRPRRAAGCASCSRRPEENWLAHALPRLPARERLVLRLRYYHGLPQSDVAPIIGAFRCRFRGSSELPWPS